MSTVSSRPRAGWKKKLLFTALVLVPLGVLCELAARSFEPTFFSNERTLPLPSSDVGAEQIAAYHQRAAETRSQDVRLRDAHRTGQPVATPLVGHEKRQWALQAQTKFGNHQYTVSTNSDGFRGDELASIDPSAIRILTLGDSSIFGTGVRRGAVFSAVAAAELSERWERPVVDIIGGVPGYTSTQSLAVLEGYGRKAKPDWVLIGPIWSDVYKFSKTSKEAVHRYTPAVGGSFTRFATYRILWRLLGPRVRSEVVGWIESREDIGDLTGEEPTRVPLSRYQQNLRAMVDVTEELGARPAFLILPAPMDFDAAPPPDTLVAYREAMRAIAEESGAPLVDGPGRFEANGGTLADFLDQVHPNSVAHAFLGDLVATALAGEPPRPLDANAPKR